VKVFDAIVVGGGIIGLTLALELRKSQKNVLVLDRAEPGGEASSAGAGMLAAAEVEGPDALCALAHLSAEMYPEFIERLESAAGLKVDFNQNGAICLATDPKQVHASMSEQQLAELEPALIGTSLYAGFSSEAFVEPRSLLNALVAYAKHEGVHIHHGSEVTSINIEDDTVTGVTTSKTAYAAKAVVNCAGAWAGSISPVKLPTRPVKGHMLALIPQRGSMIQHVVRQRDADVYLVPRADGRIAVGSTVEEAGFDKHVDPATVLRLHQSAADLLPALGEARLHESWTGLRPGTPDGFPIMGKTPIENYFVSTGHYRNGILLAPASALVMSNMIADQDTMLDISALSPMRFITNAE
jgi:glycine oxidase